MVSGGIEVFVAGVGEKVVGMGIEGRGWRTR